MLRDEGKRSLGTTRITGRVAPCARSNTLMYRSAVLAQVIARLAAYARSRIELRRDGR